MKTWIFFDESLDVATYLEIRMRAMALGQESRLRACALEHVAWWEEQLHEQQITEAK